VELGVHITFVSLTNGRIDLKRIRFRYVKKSPTLICIIQRIYTYYEDLLLYKEHIVHCIYSNYFYCFCR